MIRICYEDFSGGTHDTAGLHGRAECGARGVTVYLLPGLTAWQRRAVIRRLRQEAGRGFGPALPLPQLVIALGLDRVRTAVRITGAIVRLHPAVTLVPGAFVVALVTLFVIASAGRSGITSGTRSARSGLAGAVSAVPGRARIPRVASDDRTGGGKAGGAGLGSGRRVLVRQAREQRPEPKRTGCPSARPGAWYAFPQVTTTAVPRPHDGQHACRRLSARAVPHTAHRPGPPDFAW